MIFLTLIVLIDGKIARSENKSVLFGSDYFVSIDTFTRV